MNAKMKKRGLRANEWILIANVIVAAIAILILNVVGGATITTGNKEAFNFIGKCLLFDYGGEQSFIAFLLTAFIYINALVLIGAIVYTSVSKSPRSLLGVLSFAIGSSLLVYAWAFFYKGIQPQLDNVIKWNENPGHINDQTTAFSSLVWSGIMIVGVLVVIVYILALVNLTITTLEATKKNISRKAEIREIENSHLEITEFVATFLARTNHLDDYSNIWTSEEMQFLHLSKKSQEILRKAEYDEIVFDDGMNTFVNIKDGNKQVASDLLLCVWKYDNAIAKQNLFNFIKRDEEYSDLIKKEASDIAKQPVENKTIEKYVEKTIIIHDTVAQPVEPKVAPVPVPVVAPIIDTQEDDKISPERIPFVEKLESSEKDIQNKYNELKAYILSYGVKSRISISGDTFRLHKDEHAVITIAGKHLKIYLPLNVKDYVDTAIPVVDASHFKKYENLPLALNVRSDLSVKRAKKLIDDAMKQKGLVAHDIVEKNYARLAISGAKQK